MRKAQKQQAMELMTQMQEAHEQIKKYMEQGSVQSAMELLEDCQTGGITIGTLIEGTEGEGHPTVQLLEDYCELIYQIHTDLANDKDVNANKTYKLLRQKLIKAENSLRNDISVRTEAVFLPYKASMWDSLESVWKASDADPNCDAYVIPIPYYDKNPDGSFREMHYEGDQYPDYVPITKYDAFDFEAHRPDMIFIHNPYDSLNLVTSVPPFFFSENLKKYTDKLVYIPYFILGEIKPDEDEKIEGMKHFCTTPGVFNADKVIVQSEDMKQVYIKVLLEATNDHSEAARKYWDNKILGTGSPKIDKVLNTKKEDLEVPQEWLKVIEKPDGSWKKIVFYNTSVGALLQHNEKMLEKMASVFRIFKENQGEVALLWRPHPLIRATVESMRPQLWIEYDKLVRKYREQGWGIYDDSSDVDRAIILSDVYYGDGSSVVNLYNHIGKNVVMQSMKTNRNSIQNMLEWAVIYDDKLYFSAMEFNGIFSLDLTNGLMNIETHIEEDKRCIFRAYGRGKRRGNKLYLVPLMSEKIVIFDLKNTCYDWIALPGMDEEALKHQKSKQIVFHENDIYILPQTEYYPYIVQINEKTKQVEKHEISKYCEDPKADFCNASDELDNEKFLFCLHESLYEFLYATGEIRRSKYNSDGKIKDIYVSENEIIILESKIVICDYDWNVIDEIGLDNYNIFKNERINKIYRREKNLYLYNNYSTEAKQIYCIDIQTRELRCTNIEEEETYFLSLVVNENDIFFVYYLNDIVHFIHEDLSISDCKINAQFDIDGYILDERNWLQKFNNTYNCLNEAELLVKDLYNL